MFADFVGIKRPAITDRRYSEIYSQLQRDACPTHDGFKNGFRSQREILQARKELDLVIVLNDVLKCVGGALIRGFDAFQFLQPRF